jgi:hypothetical protein
MRLAQLATVLGALDRLDAIPDRIAPVLDVRGLLIGVPDRLVELIGAGPNAWTAQEGRAEDPRGVLRRPRGPVVASTSSTGRAWRSTSRTRWWHSTAAGGRRPHRGDRRRCRGNGSHGRALAERALG